MGRRACFLRLRAGGWDQRGGSFVVFFPSSFLCVSGLSFCEVAGKGRGSGKLLGAGVRFEVYETASLLSL